MEEEKSAGVVWSALGAEIDEPEETVEAVGATGMVVRAHFTEMLANYQPYVNPGARMRACYVLPLELYLSLPG